MSRSDISFTTFRNIVGDQRRHSANIHNATNPNTKEKLWDVPIGSQKDVDDAVACAAEAFVTWSATSIQQRRDLLNKFLDIYAQFEQELTEIMAKETGKPRMFANEEVREVGDMARYHTTVDLPVEVFEDEEKIIETSYKPLGVCAAICPWNFPIFLAMGKIAPAVMAGNTIIVKPSPYTPYTTLKLVEIMQEVFPVGVVQAVGGDDNIGSMLTAHPGIAKISFTGSIPTGKKIMAACANTLKRITLELGGNDPCIILPDVDINHVAAEVVMGSFFNTGQTCTASKRIFIHESIYQPFLQAMADFIANGLAVGDGDESKFLIGPIQNLMQYEKVKEIYEDCKAKGYKFAAAKSLDVSEASGYFVEPVIIDNPPTDSRVMQEEPFGPIVPCQPWSDENDVIKRANDTNTGLGASVWGKDVTRAKSIGSRLSFGSVWINHFEQPTPHAFFGGHKESGIGGEWGKQGILSYCNAFVMHTYK